MKPIEIIVIIVSVLIVASVFGIWIYRKINHKPTGECACCHAQMQKAIKKMRKDLKKDKNSI